MHVAAATRQPLHARIPLRGVHHGGGARQLLSVYNGKPGGGVAGGIGDGIQKALIN